MSEFKPTLRCTCDGSGMREVICYDAAPEGETKFDLGDQVYNRRYDQCKMCGHFFGRHNLDLSALYNDEYVTSTYGGIDGMQERLDKIQRLPADQSDNGARVERVVKFVEERGLLTPSPPRLLDVGAGIGVFPSSMKTRGWDVTTVEPDLRTVEHLRENVGVTAFAEDLFDLDADHIGVFEAVSFNKVLEHVEDPVGLLMKGTSFLADQGFMYVELPDVSAMAEGPSREEFFIEHHHVFSLASFDLLVEHAGLRLVRLERFREPSTKYTIAGFVMRKGDIS